MRDKEKHFLEKSSRLLDAGAEALDAATLSRLNQARQKALQRHAGGRRSRLLFSPVAVTTLIAGFAVAAIAVLLWTGMPPQLSQQQEFAQLPQYEDMEILISGTDLELLEDMTFISWLVDEDLATETGNRDAG